MSTNLCTRYKDCCIEALDVALAADIFMNVCRHRMPSLMGRASLARAPSTGVPQSWTLNDDHLLCALVAEFGPNWAFVSDVLTSTSSIQGVARRPDLCKQRYAVLQKTPMEPNENADQYDGQVASFVNISKAQGKEIMLNSLPVNEVVLRRHMEAVAPIAARVRQRHQEVRGRS